ncbi:MAG: RsmE family RNA methyltransferase [Proteobacteria bacterium]|nr:RsmE family RNA methyltransferase [Pseudomonadota bacterium]
MNLIVVESTELRGDRCTIGKDDRRFVHLRDVIGLAVGKTLRAGVANGPIGAAEIVAFDDAHVELRLATDGGVPAQLPISLVLAIPRPKVLSRVVEIAASFGVARIDLTNAWRVDKSYLASPRLAPDVLAQAARLGAEQGATTRLPTIDVHRRLMPLLDARWPAEASGDGLRLIAHPDAPFLETIATPPPDAIVALAIGPEGGWIQREVDTFVARGFQPVSLGAPILRVEAAVAALLGQLLLVRRR